LSEKKRKKEKRKFALLIHFGTLINKKLQKITLALLNEIINIFGQQHYS